MQVGPREWGCVVRGLLWAPGVGAQDGVLGVPGMGLCGVRGLLGVPEVGDIGCGC